MPYPSPKSPNRPTRRTAVITAGPTRSRIDAVRFIMNTSSGLLGSVIAEEGLRRGFDIGYFHGPFARHPRVSGDYAGDIHDVEISWIEDLLPALRTAGARFRPAAIFHAMAVLDYVPAVFSEEKLPSGTPRTLRLTPTEKIIDLLPEIFPGAKLIAFKLETRISEDLLVERAGKLARRTNAEIVVANLLEWVDDTAYRCILVDKQNTIIDSIEGRARLSRFLWDFVETSCL